MKEKSENHKKLHYLRAYLARKAAVRYEHELEAPLQRVITKLEVESINHALNEYIPKDRVYHLDVASGTGRIICEVDKLVDVSIGVDTSPNMINLAKGKTDHASFIVSDAEYLPFREGSLNLITIFRLLVHLPKGSRIKLLRECRRVLRQGGMLVFDVHSNSLSPKGFLGLLRDRIRKKRNDRLSYFQVVPEIRGAGLTLLRASSFYTSLSRIPIHFSSSRTEGIMRRVNQKLPVKFGDILFLIAKTSVRSTKEQNRSKNSMCVKAAS